MGPGVRSYGLGSRLSHGGGRAVVLSTQHPVPATPWRRALRRPPSTLFRLPHGGGRVAVPPAPRSGYPVEVGALLLAFVYDITSDTVAFCKV